MIITAPLSNTGNGKGGTEMFYLLITMCCATSMGVIVKLSELRHANRYAVNFFNSLSGMVGAFLALGGLALYDSGWFSAFFAELPAVFGQMGQFSLAASAGYALALAAFGGACNYVAYLSLQVSTARNGAAMTSTFNKVGSAVPMLLSVLFLGESPKLVQVIGSLIALAGILIIYSRREESSVITLKLALFGTLFFGGFCDFLSKLYETFAQAEMQPLYVFYYFLFAAVIALIVVLLKDRRIHWQDVAFGLAAGIPALFHSKFLLLTLGQLPAFVVFPIYSVGNIVLMNIINLLFFKEPLTRRQFFAIGLMIVAVALLNL